MPQTFQSAEDLPRARHPLRPGEGVLQLFRKRSIAFDEFFPVLAKLTACIVRVSRYSCRAKKNGNRITRVRSEDSINFSACASVHLGLSGNRSC
jgi:hypothetical protein